MIASIRRRLRGILEKESGERVPRDNKVCINAWNTLWNSKKTGDHAFEPKKRRFRAKDRDGYFSS